MSYNPPKKTKPRKTRPITVTLGDLQERVETRVSSGTYASASEVMRAALRALDREEEALTGLIRERVEESLADARPDIPAAEVFKRLRRLYTAQRRKARRQ
jgi:antitoxin ParD1/3/4